MSVCVENQPMFRDRVHACVCGTGMGLCVDMQPTVYIKHRPPVYNERSGSGSQVTTMDSALI